MNKTFSRLFKTSFLQENILSGKIFCARDLAVPHIWMFCSAKKESIINLYSLNNIGSP